MARRRRKDYQAAGATAQPQRRSAHLRPWVWAGVGALALVLIAPLVFGALVLQRIEHVELPTDVVSATQSDARIVLLVGTDAGIPRPDGDEQDTAVGRADIILLARIDRSGVTQIMSVPRDLVVSGSGLPKRIGLSLLDGPDALATDICTTLGVAVTDYVEIDIAGLTGIVDSLGGVRMTVPNPIRDPGAGLNIEQSGELTLSGAEAFALVRSRHAEELVAGSWVAVSEQQGGEDRASRASELVLTLSEALSTASPITLMRAAWSVSGELRIGGSLTPGDALKALRGDTETSRLETESMGHPLFLEPTFEGRSMLLELGMDTGCSVATAH